MTRDVWGWRWLDDLAQDVRYAVRTLFLSHRTFAVTAVLMLAIGIGVTTAVFSVVSGLLLRPLPFPRPDRLVQLHGTTSLRGPQWPQVMNLDTYRRDSTSFEAVSGYEVGARYLRDAGGTERVMVVRTERDFFAVLGVPALYGRTYDTSDASPAVVIGETFWRRRFGGGRRHHRARAGAGRPAVHGRRHHAGRVPVSVSGRLAAAGRGRAHAHGSVDAVRSADVPARPDRQRDRAAEGRRVAGRRAERVERHRETARGGVPGYQSRKRYRDRAAGARGRPGGDAAAADAVVRGGDHRARAGVRECRQPVAGEDDAPAAGSRRPLGARRVAASPGAPVPDRESAPCADRRRRGPAARVVDPEAADRGGGPVPAAGARGGPRLARLRLHARRLRGGRHRAGRGARRHRGAPRSALHPPGIERPVHDESGAAPAAERPRRRRGGARVRAGRRRLGPAARARPAARDRRGDCPGQRHHVSCGTAAQSGHRDAVLRHRRPGRRPSRRAGRRIRAAAAAPELGLDEQLERFQGTRPARQARGVPDRAPVCDAGVLRGARHSGPARPRLHAGRHRRPRRRSS